MNIKRPLLSEITLNKSTPSESVIRVQPNDEGQANVKALSIRVREDAWRQLRELALRETSSSQRITAQSLIVEALNMLFKDRQLPEIAVAPPLGSASRKR